MSKAKSIILAAALLSATSAFAIVPEGSYPEQPSVSVAEARNRADVAAEATRDNSAGQLGLIRGEDRPQFVQSYDQHTLSRSTVIAERDAFARSGAQRIGNEA